MSTKSTLLQCIKKSQKSLQKIDREWFLNLLSEVFKRFKTMLYVNNEDFITIYTKYNTIHNFLCVRKVHYNDICYKEWDKTLFLPATFRH